MKHFLLSALLCILTALPALSIDIPKEHIFVFERNSNSNYVCYDINLDGDNLNAKEPLQTYWVLGQETRMEPLTFLDRKMAFGVKVVKATEQEATVHLTAYKALKIRLCRHEGKWVGIVNLNGRTIILEKMFAQMKPPMYVKCEYVDIHGTDLKTGQKVRERINP